MYRYCVGLAAAELGVLAGCAAGMVCYSVLAIHCATIHCTVCPTADISLASTQGNGGLSVPPSHWHSQQRCHCCQAAARSHAEGYDRLDTDACRLEETEVRWAHTCTHTHTQPYKESVASLLVGARHDSCPQTPKYCCNNAHRCHAAGATCAEWCIA